MNNRISQFPGPTQLPGAAQQQASPQPQKPRLFKYEAILKVPGMAQVPQWNVEAPDITSAALIILAQFKDFGAAAEFTVKKSESNIITPV